MTKEDLSKIAEYIRQESLKTYGVPLAHHLEAANWVELMDLQVESK